MNSADERFWEPSSPCDEYVGVLTDDVTKPRQANLFEFPTFHFSLAKERYSIAIGSERWLASFEAVVPLIKIF